MCIRDRKQNADFYSSVSAAIDKALDSYSTDAASCSNAIQAVSGRVQNLISGYQELSDSLTAIANAPVSYTHLYQTRLTVSDDIGQILRHSGKTALLVTHDLSEAISLDVYKRQLFPCVSELNVKFFLYQPVPPPR